MGHGTVQIVDAGNAGHAHLRVMVPSMGLGIICPEQRADSLRANKNPRVRNQRKDAPSRLPPHPTLLDCHRPPV